MLYRAPGFPRSIVRASRLPKPPAALSLSGGDPWLTLDGRLNQPLGGNIPHPHALDFSAATNEFGRTYVTRPAWQVAGVDYPIGPSAAKLAALKNPETGGDATPAGWNFDRVNRIATQIAHNAVLDGWDMRAGWGIRLGDPSLGSWDNAIITNNLITNGGQGFIVGQFGAGNTMNTGLGATIKYNVMDGAFVNPGDNVNMTVGVPLTFQYNWYKNVQGDLFDIGAVPSYYTSGLSFLDMRYNVIENNGTGAGHSDLLQTFWSGPNQIIRFSGPLITGNSISGTINIGAGAVAWGPVSFTADDLTTRTAIANAIAGATGAGQVGAGATTSQPEIICAYAVNAFTVTMSISGGASQASFTIAEYTTKYESQVIDFNLWITSVTYTATQGTNGIDYAGNTHDADNTGHGASYWNGPSTFGQNTCLCPRSANSGLFGGFPAYCRSLIAGSLSIKNNFVDPVGINGYPPGNFLTAGTLGVTPTPPTSFKGFVYRSGNTSLLDGTQPAAWNGDDIG